MRLDVALVDRGLVRSRNRATRLILDGLVSVNGSVTAKVSTKTTSDDLIEVVQSSEPEFASRASYKLLRTLEALEEESGFTVTGARALDVGASTGGFTDVLLRRGAQSVVALDVGHDQLVPEIRRDGRVYVLEGYNARNLSVADLPYTPDLVVCDVSFISLTLIIDAVSRSTTPTVRMLLMVKPQFEVGRNLLGSGGVVRDPESHAVALERVARDALLHGLRVEAVIPSSLPGPHGNREFFLYLSKRRTDAGEETSSSQNDLPHGVREAIRLAVDSSSAMSEESDMIEGQINLPIVKGIPAQQVVPPAQIFWA